MGFSIFFKLHLSYNFTHMRLWNFLMWLYYQSACCILRAFHSLMKLWTSTIVTFCELCLISYWSICTSRRFGHLRSWDNYGYSFHFAWFCFRNTLFIHFFNSIGGSLIVKGNNHCHYPLLFILPFFCFSVRNKICNPIFICRELGIWR